MATWKGTLNSVRIAFNSSKGTLFLPCATKICFNNGVAISISFGSFCSFSSSSRSSSASSGSDSSSAILCSTTFLYEVLNYSRFSRYFLNYLNKTSIFFHYWNCIYCPFSRYVKFSFEHIFKEVIINRKNSIFVIVKT